MADRRKNTITILGAGPAGLAAADECIRRGIKPLVLEREGQPGGLCATIHHEGFSYDIGGHRLFTRDQFVEQEVKALLGEDLLTVDRKSRIFSRGRYFQYPLDPVDAFRNLGIVDAGRAGKDYLLAKLDGSPNRSFEDWTKKAFGKYIYDRFFGEYTRKVWGIPGSKISADWASQRVRNLNLAKAVLDSLGLIRKPPTSLVSQFYYARRGFGQIYDNLAARITEAGGEIRCDSRVAGFEKDGKRISRIITSGARDETWEVDKVISTIPLPVLARELVPEVSEQASGLQFRGLITVLLTANRAPLLEDHWLYFPNKDIPFGRLHEPYNWSKDLSPRGHSSLVVEWFASPGDGLWQEDDGRLIQTTIEVLENQLKLVSPGSLKGAQVKRWQEAYPVYDLGYQEKLTPVHEALAGIENLALAGRGGQFRYHNADHAMLTGYAAVDALLGGASDPMNVNQDGRYLES